MVKNILMFFLCTVLISNALARNYEIGDTLHVISTNGLNLRSKPNLDSEILAKIDFGQKVVVADNHHWEYSDKVSFLNGHWVEVIVKGMRAYLFDAYLTELPIPSKEPKHNECGEDFAILLQNYIDANFQYKRSPMGDAGSWVSRLSNGDSIIFTQHYEGYSFSLTSYSKRLTELYALARALIEKCSSQPIYEKRGHVQVGFHEKVINNLIFLDDAHGKLYKIKNGKGDPYGSFVKINRDDNNKVTLEMIFPCC